jgi:hypothetical protein
MQMRVDGSDKVLEDAPALLAARRNGGPYAFAPSATCFAARALGDSLVDDQGTNHLLGEVVGRFDTRHGEEGEVAVGSFAFESLCECVRFSARRWMASNAQEFLPNAMRASKIDCIAESFSSVDSFEESPHACKEFASPMDQHLVRVLGEEPDLANQVRHTKLHDHWSLAHVLAIGREEVATDHSTERFREYSPKDLGAAGRIDMEYGEVVGSEAPGPQIFARLRMARLVYAKARLRGEHLAELNIGLLKRVGDLLNDLGQLATAHRDLKHFLEELLDAGIGDMAFRFQETDQGRELRPDEPGATNLDRHRRIYDAASAGVHVLASTVLGHGDRRLDEVCLLNHGPRLEHSKAFRFFSGQFVRYYTIDALGRKRRPFVPRMSRLTADTPFLLLPRSAARRRLDDIGRRRLRARTGIPREARDLRLQCREFCLHSKQPCSQIFDLLFLDRVLRTQALVFALQLLYPKVLVVHAARYTTRRCGNLVISRNSRKP